MKKYLYIILTALAALPFVACQEEEEVFKPEVKDITVVSVKNLVFLPAGGSGTISVDCATSFTATSDKNWCTVSVNGNEVTVTASANPSNESRYASVLMQTSQSSQTVVVQQVGEVLDGMALSDALAPKEGTTFVLRYSSNIDVQMTSDQDWIHFEKVDDEKEGTMFKVIVDENKNFGTRFATITYTAGSLSGSAKITQEPTYGTIDGWTVEDTDGQFIFPDQIDVIRVTPPAAKASTPYFWGLIDPSELIGEDVPSAIKSLADSVMEEAQAGRTTLSKGTDSQEGKNLPSTTMAVIVCFDDQYYPTGEYALVEVTIPDRGPVKQVVDGWEITHVDGSYAHPDQTDQFTITPKADFENVKYIATVVSKASIASVEDFAFSTFAMETREAILAKVASGELPNFDAGLNTGTTTIDAKNVAPDAYVVVVAFGDNQFYTGDYQVAEFAVPDLMPAYYQWLGEWSVPRGDGADTWIVTENVPLESFKVSGIAGFDADDYAVGAFVAIVPYDAATGEMVFKVYENTGVTWQDSSRGTMNALLSGQYTNVEGKTYYNSGVGNTIARAKLTEDGQTADLTPRAVTSAGAPAYFYNIKWYGRYTNSSGSRSGVSWTGYETALPNTMTKK